MHMYGRCSWTSWIRCSVLFMISTPEMPISRSCNVINMISTPEMPISRSCNVINTWGMAMTLQLEARSHKSLIPLWMT